MLNPMDAPGVHDGRAHHRAVQFYRDDASPIATDFEFLEEVGEQHTAVIRPDPVFERCSVRRTA